MNLKIDRLACFRRVAYACTLAASAPLLAGEHSTSPDPADATSVVPPVTYSSQLPGTRKQYLKQNDAARLPWRRLFKPDGDFVSEAELGVDSPQEPMIANETRPTKVAVPAGASDSRGVIRSINREQGKVKLKHGPIERLEMPGMTMVFRVKDKALLDQIKEGDEVGFTVEMDGSKFFVTGFQE